MSIIRNLDFYVLILSLLLLSYLGIKFLLFFFKIPSKYLPIQKAVPIDVYLIATLRNKKRESIFLAVIRLASQKLLNITEMQMLESKDQYTNSSELHFLNELELAILRYSQQTCTFTALISDSHILSLAQTYEEQLKQNKLIYKEKEVSLLRNSILLSALIIFFITLYRMKLVIATGHYCYYCPRYIHDKINLSFYFLTGTILPYFVYYSLWPFYRTPQGNNYLNQFETTMAEDFRNTDLIPLDKVDNKVLLLIAIFGISQFRHSSFQVFKNFKESSLNIP